MQRRSRAFLAHIRCPWRRRVQGITTRGQTSDTGVASNISNATMEDFTTTKANIAKHVAQLGTFSVWSHTR